MILRWVLKHTDSDFYQRGFGEKMDMSWAPCDKLLWQPLQLVINQNDRVNTCISLAGNLKHLAFPDQSGTMAFMRSATAATFRSRSWSTTELGDGLAHLLTDGRLELPDDMSQLKDFQSSVSQVSVESLGFSSLFVTIENLNKSGFR